MASFNARQRDPLLDQTTQAMVEKRGKELLGLLLIALAVVLSLMLGSYSPDDPGWMVASDEPARNIFGRFGAAISSTLTIIIGQGAWSLSLLLAAWGLRFVLHRGQERVVSRAIFGWVLVIVASAYASTHVPGDTWVHSFGLGGLFGDTILGMIVGGLPDGLMPAGLKISSVVLAAALLMAAAFTLGFDPQELRAIGRFLLLGTVVLYGWILAGLRLVGINAAQGAAGLGQRLRERRETRREPAPQAETACLPPRVATLRQPASAAAAAGPDAGYAAAPLPAAPRSADATRSLRARVEGLIRRSPEPALPQELVEPIVIETDIDAPSDERIRSRISDAIRAKARAPVAPKPITGRSEPPVQRSGRAEVPIAPAVSRAVAAAQARAAAGVPLPRPVPKAATALGAVAGTVVGGALAAPAAAAPLVAERMPTFEGFEDWNTGELIETPLADDLPPEGQDDFEGEWEMTAAERHAAELAEDDFGDEDELLADRRAYGAELEADYGAEAAAPAEIVRRGEAYTQSADLEGTGDQEDEDDSFDSWQETQGRGAPIAAPQVAPDIRRGTAPAPQPGAPRRVVTATRETLGEAQLRAQIFDRQSPPYEAPPLGLLTSPSSIERHHLSDEALEDNARMLESVLEDYGVKGEIVSVRPGPVVTMYELEPAPGLKASRVIGLADDIARSMSALSARVSTVPGRSVIGIELPNLHREKVVLREIITARDFADQNMRLPLALGKDIGGEPIIANLAKMPHLLIAGTTGSGKSVAINTMILSLLYKLTPEECRLIMIDPKMLELSVYDGIPHLLSPVVTDPKKAVVALKWVVGEMEERYRKMSKMGVRNIEGYNGRVREALAKGEMFKRTIQTGFDDETGDPVFETDEFAPQPFPYIVVIVDEMADLMMVAGKEIEACIQRLAQMARASGIHLIMATQRPSVDVITGTIKANFPTRISFQVTSKIDSRTILGEMGAEQLLGMGDMLYMAGGGRISRIHGPFVSDEEVEEIVTHLKSFGPPAYMSGVVDGPDEDKVDDIDQVLGLGGGENSEDALYDQAVAIVARDRKCSTSYIQRKLGIGYQKAARLVEQMEDQGVVSTANHVGKREILLPEH